MWIMKIKLPYYSSRDYLVLALVLLPVTVIINSVVFGWRYFSQPWLFLGATIITGIAFAVYFVLCGKVAVMLKKRFPAEEQTSLKLTLMITSFLVMTGLYLLLLFRGYEWMSFFGYRFNEHNFVWAYIGLGIVNIFLTFLFEGISRFESWKANLRETEQLQKAYRQGQIQSLKSQVNPHFLFNSLNSLSSLIAEDCDAAERYLDEMSKVYRYMLRTDEEQLVTLETEMKFLSSYLHLLNTRYGTGLQVKINFNESDKSKLLPPLTLQVLIENAFTQNTMSKASPLVISIESTAGGLLICNNRQARIMTGSMEYEAGLDNIVRKYELLNNQRVVINETPTERRVLVPLISMEKEAVA
jgi:two-component system, LytTR family, sensor kinase